MTNNTMKKIIMLGLLLGGCLLTSIVPQFIAERKAPVTISAAETGGQQGKNGAVLNGAAQNAGNAKTGAENLTYSKGSAKKKQQTEPITVYVNGAVQFPGLYKLQPGARAGEAVAAAGGYTQDANTDRVNIARRLRDGSQVFVPYQKKRR